MKRSPNTAIVAFITVVRSLFPQLGLFEPSECRFANTDGSPGGLAGIIDERNGIIDIAKGPEHVIFKFPRQERIQLLQWQRADGNAEELFSNLGIPLRLSAESGKYQTICQHDLAQGVIIVQGKERYYAFKVPAGTLIEVHHKKLERR